MAFDDAVSEPKSSNAVSEPGEVVHDGKDDSDAVLELEKAVKFSGDGSHTVLEVREVVEDGNDASEVIPRLGVKSRRDPGYLIYIFCIWAYGLGKFIVLLILLNHCLVSSPPNSTSPAASMPWPPKAQSK
ncbi:hypothetical protein K440DRAFT_671092 [Wilcoxina mikolae CBS 423.85]|nr:hypothetical protein K440DRAFT_671092 [Wilcoxina mikolae CBS 423.85]